MPVNLELSFDLITPKKVFWSDEQIEFFQRITTFVNKIDNFRFPKAQLEQYSLPSDLIAFILILAADDLVGKNIVDLGCGTGRFTLPIKKFFSNRVLGVDIDLDAMNHLVQLRKQNKLELDLLIAPVEFLETNKWGKNYQITFMNPPFGTKRRKLDMVFLKQALKYSKKVISIHKSNPETFNLIKHLGRKFRKSVEILATVDFPIFSSFQFHRKHKHFVRVDLMRIAE